MQKRLEKIGSLLKPGDILAMTGTLAAGKTTITKGIAKSLGVKDNITSPTFCLVSEYEGEKMPLYHMDVYRLEGEEDFANLGVEDMLYGNGVCIIEWSEKVKKELPNGLKRTILRKEYGDETLQNQHRKGPEAFRWLVHLFAGRWRRYDCLP